jgi:hypothetical protein
VKNPDADFWQPNPGTYTVPLNAGGVLLINNGSDDLPCPAARLNATTTKWECVTLPFVPKGTLRQDSRGWLTQVEKTAKDELELKTSSDGGVSWKSLTITAPEDTGFEEFADHAVDVKVNGKLGQAVLSGRLNNKKGIGQDVVYRVDISKAQPRLMKTYYVGKGDISTIVGIVGATSDRFDYPSVALFPDGRIAVSFDDSTTPKQMTRDTIPSATNPNGHSPAIAVLD